MIFYGLVGTGCCLGSVECGNLRKLHKEAYEID